MHSFVRIFLIIYNNNNTTNNNNIKNNNNKNLFFPNREKRCKAYESTRHILRITKQRRKIII